MLKSLRVSTFAIGTALALGACNTTVGTTPLQTGAPLKANATFSDMVDYGNRLITDYGSATASTSVPTSGTAQFDGVGASSTTGPSPILVVNNATSIYEVEATVDFDNSNFTGRAFNFKSTQAGYVITGELAASGNMTGADFSGNYAGTLTEQGIPITYAGTIDGSFVGTSAAAMVGTGQGTGTISGSSVPFLNFYSYWGAEQR